ncbi:hypothetical protein B0H14DRAFT_2309839, partial [Mycena olivaceomarginata]
HFRTLKREVFGHVTQCCIGHCFVSKYYNKFIPSEDIDCLCGEIFQIHEHLLCD